MSALNVPVLRGPSFRIKLSTRKAAFKSGDKATLYVELHNQGKGVSGVPVDYSFHCTPSCPLLTNNGKLTKAIQPGGTFRFSVKTKALSKGEYRITLKTKHGVSGPLKLKVSPASRLKSAPSRLRSLPSQR